VRSSRIDHPSHRALACIGAVLQVGLAIGVGSPTAARAESAETDVEVDVATGAVSGAESSAESDAPSDEVLVRGFRSGRIETPPTAFGTIVATEDYAAENKMLEDILAQQPGVFLRRFGGPGSRSEISIRGSTGAQVAVQLDGVPLNDAISGSTDPAQFCVGMVDSIGVARGGGALLGGGSAIGGVVSLRTRRPGAVAANRASVSGGAFGTWQGTAFRAAQAGPLDYSAGYCFFLTDGDYRFARPVFDVLTQTSFTPAIIERINNDRQRQSGSVSLGGELGGHGYLVFRDYLTWAEHGEPGLDAQDGPSGGQNPLARSEDLHNIAQLEYTAEDLGLLGTELRASLWHRYQDNRFSDPGIDENVEPTDTQTEVSTVGLDVTDTWRGDWLGASHAFSVRAHAKRESLFTNDGPDRGRTITGFGIEEDARFFGERLTIVPTVRYEWAQDLGDRWMPGIGLVVTPFSWLRLKGNVQRAWRVPSFDELYLPDKGFIRGNPDLRPEEADSYDVGSSWWMPSGRSRRSVSPARCSSRTSTIRSSGSRSARSPLRRSTPDPRAFAATSWPSHSP